MVIGTNYGNAKSGAVSTVSGPTSFPDIGSKVEPYICFVWYNVFWKQVWISFLVLLSVFLLWTAVTVPPPLLPGQGRGGSVSWTTPRLAVWRRRGWRQNPWDCPVKPFFCTSLKTTQARPALSSCRLTASKRRFLSSMLLCNNVGFWASKTCNLTVSLLPDFLFYI